MAVDFSEGVSPPVLVREERGRAARLYLYSSVLWLVIGLAVGVLVAFLFVNPDLLRHVVPGSVRAMVHFGRLQPIYTNTIVFGWLTMAVIGVALTLTPLLTRTPIRHEVLAQLTAWAVNAVVGAGALSLLIGMTKGRELAEYVMPLNAVWLVAILAVGYVLVANYREREADELYVSLWYFAASVVWVGIIYFVGNVMWRPTGSLTGIADAIVNWFYVHNLLDMWLGMMGLGIAYYLVPVLTGRPLYSGKLAAIGFWGMACLMPATGAYMLWEPMPPWLQSASIAFTALLAVPMWAVLVNLVVTAGQSWRPLMQAVPGRFLVVGLIGYLLTWVGLIAEAIPAFGAVLYFTPWVAGHTQLALIGSYGFVALAGVYYALPLLTGRQWSSDKLINMHFWLTVAGAAVLVVSLGLAGLAQGSAWAAGTAFDQSVAVVRPYMLGQAFAALLLLFAQAIFAYHVTRTATGGQLVVSAAGYRSVQGEAR